MSKTVKRIILIVVILAVIIIGAVFVSEPQAPEASLQSVSTGQSGAPLTQAATTDPSLVNTQEINREFISMLLNLQSINLNDDIFSEPAFLALTDNTIRLNQPGNEGRSNPFAPIGVERVGSQASANSALTATPSEEEASLETEAQTESSVDTPQAQSSSDFEGVESSNELSEEELEDVLSSLGSS